MITERPEFIPLEDWPTLQEELRRFRGAIRVFAHHDELLVMTQFGLYCWDPVDGCFMPVEELS